MVQFYVLMTIHFEIYSDHHTWDSSFKYIGKITESVRFFLNILFKKTCMYLSILCARPMTNWSLVNIETDLFAK